MITNTGSGIHLLTEWLGTRERMGKTTCKDDLMAYALYILILLLKPLQKRDTYQHIFGGLAFMECCAFLVRTFLWGKLYIRLCVASLLTILASLVFGNLAKFFSRTKNFFPLKFKQTRSAIFLSGSVRACNNNKQQGLCRKRSLCARLIIRKRQKINQKLTSIFIYMKIFNFLFS